MYGSEDCIFYIAKNMTDSKLKIFFSRDITIIVIQSYPLLIMYGKKIIVLK